MTATGRIIVESFCPFDFNSSAGNAVFFSDFRSLGTLWAVDRANIFSAPQGGKATKETALRPQE